MKAFGSTARVLLSFCMIFSFATSLKADSNQIEGTVATHWVGSHLFCDFDNLQDAIDAADDGDTIRIQNDPDHFRGETHRIMNKSLTLVGGYDECYNVPPPPSGHSVLDADAEGIVLEIRQSSGWISGMEVNLENLVFTGGDTRSPNTADVSGAGLAIYGRRGSTLVNMRNVSVTDNVAEYRGGGILLFTTGPEEGIHGEMLTIDNDSEIVSNSAIGAGGVPGSGGGLACVDPYDSTSRMARIGTAEFLSNDADLGGAIHADGCRFLSLFMGGPNPFLPTGGIQSNSAQEDGGGIYLENGARLVLRGIAALGFGDHDHAATLMLNEAGNRGGAAYVTGESTELQLIDVYIEGNEADYEGGAIWIGDGASVTMARDGDGPCDDPDEMPRCSVVAGNTAESGGAFWLQGDSYLNVNRTILRNNSSDGLGSIARVIGDLVEEEIGVAVFENVLAHGNDGEALFYSASNSELDIHGSTITDNPDSEEVIHVWATQGFSADVNVTTSIIWEDPAEVDNLVGVGFGGPISPGDMSASSQCLIGFLSEGDAGFSSHQFYSHIDPQLIDDSGRKYIPNDTSPAIDYCVELESDEDMLGNARGTPHQGPPLVAPPSSPGGSYDLGAYETDWGAVDQGDEIFGDRFEG